MFIVGKIVGVHGLKGELKVKADTDFNRFDVGKTLYICDHDQYQPMKVTSHRPHKGLELITFNGCYDINLVLELVGKDIYTLHEDDELADGQFYYEYLIDKRVESDEGVFLGLVSNLREVPQGVLLEINHNGKMVLIPFVDEFIKEVTDEVIIVHLIEGLL
ncbi:MAG: ribosome maturation factor RimM [Bacilli bacterium]